MGIVTEGGFCHWDCDGLNPNITTRCFIYLEDIKYDYKNQEGIFRCAKCLAEFPIGNQNSSD
jgi:hypothetical protein